MAQNSLGLNMTFPIKQEDGTSFHDLILYKATSDSVVMSLGDKITGDVYYKDNTLDVTMSEYIEYKANPDDENEEPIHYILVNPPTIVREGMVSDNSELKGMTKYSFEFYHPMYQLGNFPFTDVATTSDEEKYLSENKSFSWIGKPQDFIDKLNKNLQGTAWYVRKSNRFPVEKDDELSEVQQFDKISVAEAIKKGYEIWEIPYIVSQLPSNDPLYAQGKRFVVEYGLPSNEIYENESARQLDTPFVFHMGQGVGLKNNSRTPRNNKIVTRIAGFGSEDNIPYGYPQIIWTGNQDWEYTINNDANNPLSYPIYSGIVGGRYVKLIKHPFTRSHLMPSIFSETVNKKVNPNAEGYNPNIEIKDYYDAVATQEYPYTNEINPQAPSYENHEFEDIKPELDSERNTGIISATPLNNDLTPADHWDDEIDDNGSYIQSYFKIKLPQLSFDLYACAAITQEMQVNMRSGSCIGCTFTVSVDWDDYKNNFYDVDGNFAPDGSQRNLDKYPKSNLGEIEIILQKDNNTFGKIMPNVYQQPNSGDLFVFIGISLPTSYIKEAEKRLDDAMKSYMLENNVYYFDYPLKFDEYFLATRKNILGQIHPNSIIHFDYGGEELQLYVKQLTVKYGNNPLPQYDITLTDNIEITLNQIGQVASDVEKLSSLISILRQTYSRNVWTELSKKLSKVQDDTAQGFITFLKGLQVGNQFVSGLLGEGGVFRKDKDGKVYIEADKLYIRTKAYFDNVEIKDYEHTSGNRIASKAGMKCVKVEAYNSSDVLLAVNPETEPNGTSYYRCYFRAKDGEETINNDFVVGDQAFCDKTTFVNNNLSHHRYWRLVVGKNGTLTEEEEFGYIDLSASDKESGSNVPLSGDDISQLGNRNVQDRQGAIIEYVGGDNAPSYQIYQNINSYSLEGKNVIDMGFNSQTGRARMNVAGDFRFGSQTDNGSYVKYDQSTGTLKIKANVEFTNSDSDLDEFVQAHQRDDSYDDTDVQNALKAINGSIGSINSDISDINGDIGDINDDITGINGSITSINTNIGTINNSITSINATTQNLQDQIDGAITTYFMSGVPTLTNAPASSWTTDIERNKHINDLYYDKDTGYGYHFLYDDSEKKYKWVVITDKDVTKALADAAKAQATADGKRTVYSVWGAWVQSGVNTLEIGDLFIPASDTTQGNVTYKANKVYKCTTKGSNAFREVAYTDDTKVDGILGNTYYQQLAGGTINSLIGTAQTTADTAVTNAANAQTSANNANNKLTSWANSGKIAPTEILALKNQKTDIENEYAQIIADANRYSVNNASFVTAYNNAIAALNYHTDATHAASDGTITIVTDTTKSYYFGYISAYYSARQTILNAIAAKAKEYAETQGNKFLNDAVYKAIKSALGSQTDIAGGLVLTSLIGMRQNAGTSANPQYVVWGGISGEYDANAKGKGIAAWYGGEMSDKEDTSTSSERPAQSLFRFDGSGYLAGGNISWDKDGVVTIANVYSIIDNTQVAWGAETLQYMTNLSNLLPIKVINSVTYLDPKVSLTALGIKENLSVGGNLSVSGILSVGSNIKINNKDVATQEWVNNNYITKSFFDSLFQLYNDTTKIDANGTIPSSSKLNIKAMFGFWTEQYISALGKNDSSSGSGGNVGVLNDLNDVTLTSPTANQILVFDGTHWKNQNQQSVYQLPQATSSALGGIKIGYTTTGKNYAIQLDSNGKAFVNVPWTDTTYSLPLAASGTRGGIQLGYTQSGKNYPVQLSGEKAYVNVPWENTTYTLAGLMGSSAKGSATQPIYWTGSAFANTSYTLGKSVPSDAKFTDTTYSANNGVGLSGTTFYNSGVRAVTLDGNHLRVNTNGTITDSPINADLLDGYHANEVYKAASSKINNPNTSNTWIRIATITIPSGVLASAGFTAIFSNRECLEPNSFILTLAIRREVDNNKGVIFYYNAIQSLVPDTITLRSDDNITFYVYIKSAANSCVTYYNVTKLLTDGNITYENQGTTSPISGTKTNINASKGGNVLLADSATNDSDGNAINSTYLKLSGGTMTGGITCSTSGKNLVWGNITIYGGGSNGGKNSILIGDDVTIGDCNLGGIMGMKSTGNNCGFKFFNSSGTSIGGVQSTNGTLQWINSAGTAYNILDSSNSSVSLSGQTLTVKINGTSQSLTNTWRSIQNNLISSSTTDSLSAYQGYLLANGSARDNTKLPLAGGTLTGNLYFSNTDTAFKGIYGTMGGNDYWRIGGSATASDQGYLEIATSDNGDEPIYVRQYNWSEDGMWTNIKRTLTLLDSNGNTIIPGSVTANSYSTSNYVKIGDAYLTYDSTNNAIRVSKNADGTGAANFYALGGVSALGAGSSGSGGSGVDMTTVWAALNNPTTEQINASHLSTALNGYATQSWVQGQGYLTSHQSLANYATKTWVSQTYLPLSGGELSGNLIIGGSDIPEVAGNFLSYASAHAIKFYRNGFLIPYQMDNTNDGGFFRVRGTSESNVVCEIGTWDDSGDGETIQFNYYPTASTINPTYSVSVPKATGTLALTSQLPTSVSQLSNDVGYITSSGSCAYATTANQLNTFYIPYNRPVSIGGNGKQWERICTFTDTEVPTTQKWYGKYAEIEFYTNGYGSGGNYTYLGRVSFCVRVAGQTSIKNANVTIKWQDSKKDVWDVNHFKAVVTDTSVEFFVFDDIWDTSIAAMIIRKDGLSFATPSSSDQYTESDFTTYCSGKTVIDAIQDTNIWVGNSLNATKATQDSDGNAINTTYLKRSGGSMTTTNVVTNLNADLLDGMHLTSDITKPWNTIPYIEADGVMEVGKYFDFHNDNTTGSDYSTRLLCTGNYSNTVNLPSATGTLALTSDNVASATKLQTARTLWGQSFNGTGNVSGNMSGVGSIIANGSITSFRSDNGGFVMYPGNASGEAVRIECVNSSGTWVRNGITLLQNGNVGIGTNTPSKKLTVNGELSVAENATLKTITATSMATSYTDTWSDGTHAHPWYGYDHRYANTGVYSTTISDYFGMTLKTWSGNISMTNAGNVGIGTFTPSYKLDVNGTLHASGATTLSSTLSVSNNTTIGGTLGVTGTTTLASALSVSRSHVQITNAALVVDGDTTFYDSVTLKETLFLGSDDDVTLSVDGATNGESGGTFDIEAATGYVIQLWNTTNILADLSVSGDITANGNITSEHNILAKGGVTALSTSDRRKKTNITKANSIDTLKSLGGTFEFDWIDGSGHSIGFIAQNVEKSALNDMVYTTDDGYMKLNYLDTRLISLAVGGIIEVDDEVTKLKKRVKELEEEVKQLKAN